MVAASLCVSVPNLLPAPASLARLEAIAEAVSVTFSVETAASSPTVLALAALTPDTLNNRVFPVARPAVRAVFSAPKLLSLYCVAVTARETLLPALSLIFESFPAPAYPINVSRLAWMLVWVVLIESCWTWL